MENAHHKTKVKKEALGEQTELKTEVNAEAPLKKSELEEAPGAEAQPGAEQDAVPEEALDEKSEVNAEVKFDKNPSLQKPEPG